MSWQDEAGTLVNSLDADGVTVSGSAVLFMVVVAPIVLPMRAVTVIGDRPAAGLSRPEGAGEQARPRGPRSNCTRLHDSGCSREGPRTRAAPVASLGSSAALGAVAQLVRAPDS